jgi:hypothetical protein
MALSSSDTSSITIAPETMLSTDSPHPIHNEKYGSSIGNPENPSSPRWLEDPQNLTNWSSARKWMIIMLLVTTNFVAYISIPKTFNT